MVRVTKPGGIIAVGVEYSTLSEADEVKVMGFAIHERARLEKRVNSVAELLSLFEEHVEHLYFSHDAPLKRSHSGESLAKTVSNSAVIFSVRK